MATSPLRFYPHFKVLDYSGGKEKREELRDDITTRVSAQGLGWAKATFPFHIMLAHYEVILIILRQFGSKMLGSKMHTS